MNTNALINNIGTVYGVALNDQDERLALNNEFSLKPYLAAPKAPVLYIKTRNTFALPGAAVVIGNHAIKIDATVGLVMARDAKSLSLDNALAAVESYVIVSDLTIAHQSYYRPAIAQRCQDGFCPMSDRIAPPQGFELNQSKIRTYVNNQLVHERSFARLVRPLEQLLVDVTEFMTLSKGDVLLVGLPHQAPLARAGDTVKIEVSGLGSLVHTLVLSDGVSA